MKEISHRKKGEYMISRFVSIGKERIVGLKVFFIFFWMKKWKLIVSRKRIQTSTVRFLDMRGLHVAKK